MTGRADAETSPEAKARLTETEGDLRHPGQPATLGTDQRNEVLALLPYQIIS